MERPSPSPSADPQPSESPESGPANDQTLQGLVSLSAEIYNGFGVPISRSIGVNSVPVSEETFAQLFVSSDVPKKEAIPCGVVIIGNTTRSYLNQITEALYRIPRLDPHEFESLTATNFVSDAVQNPDIARKLVDLNCDIAHVQTLGTQNMTRNYMNLQSVLGMTVTETHAKYLCAMIIIFRYHGLQVNDVDLQSCNGFLDCWSNQRSNRVSFVDLLAVELNVHIPWPVRIIAYQHQTTLDGKRVVYPDGYEWQAHFLFDRVRVYTKAGAASEKHSSVGPMLRRFINAICESCTDDRQLGGTGLDSVTNCLGAVGLVCTRLRTEGVHRGLSRVEARHQVAQQLRQEGRQCDLAVVEECFFTSQLAHKVGSIAHCALRRADQFWDPNVTLNPRFDGVINQATQVEELMEKALRAAILGQDESLQTCLSVVPMSMCLDEGHPKSDNWAFVEFSERIGTIETAICEGRGAEENEARFRKYRDYLDRTEAYPEGEDASYHLGPPGTQFPELGVKCALKIGNWVEADKGQGLRIEAKGSSTFDLRCKGTLSGKLVAQDRSLRFEKGNRLKRAVKRLKWIKMLSLGWDGLQVEFKNAQDVLFGSAEGISHAVLSGAFGAPPAVWLIAQMTQGSLRMKSPLPSYLQGIVEADENGMVAPPYIGHSVLSKLQFLTDKNRLCLNVETTNKVLVLKEGTSMYETCAEACNLPSGSWWRCTAKGLKPLG